MAGCPFSFYHSGTSLFDTLGQSNKMWFPFHKRRSREKLKDCSRAPLICKRVSPVLHDLSQGLAIVPVFWMDSSLHWWVNGFKKVFLINWGFFFTEDWREKSQKDWAQHNVIFIEGFPGIICTIYARLTELLCINCMTKYFSVYSISAKIEE